MPEAIRARHGDRRVPKRESLVARVSVEQKALIKRAAALRGEPVSRFVVESAQRAAEEAIRSHDVITLSVRDSQHFAALILNPPEPNDHLRAAMRRHAAEVEDAEL